MTVIYKSWVQTGTVLHHGVHGVLCFLILVVLPFILPPCTISWSS